MAIPTYRAFLESNMHHILNKLPKRFLPPTNRHRRICGSGNFTCLCPGCSLGGGVWTHQEAGQHSRLGLRMLLLHLLLCPQQTSIYWPLAEMLPLLSDQSLMSWDSDILASVFLTRRAVSLDAGLWAQHSVMSFPICLRHCEKEEECWNNVWEIYYLQGWQLIFGFQFWVHEVWK